ncbi:M4 family peptidase [Novosphingobium sp. FGD1]|uniref:Neutral metalloproteinase n=1 Tax=Novosphingobium silvae TaxID=2692619 RepID=A0A7X4GK98_9SPHN|nr:M4 family metallopeptidase [Novosphingobium silvae]MYM00198.1 M4 family peptidase [Novosphingobium silvae]
MPDHRHEDRCCICGFIPPYLVESLADSEDARVRKVAFATLEATTTARATRLVNPSQLLGRSVAPGQGRSRVVYDMEGRSMPLPGTLRRTEYQSAVLQDEVDEAFENAGRTYEFYRSVMGLDSLDGGGFPIVSSVNFGFQVGNAFWDGERIVYGAGDGNLFLPFTRSLAVAAHEMSHGVLSFSSDLDYEGETGALNESFCDVMGISVEQYTNGTSVAEARWSLGAELLGPALADVEAIRTFEARPAFKDHPNLSTDPQPKHMRDYVFTDKDRGGVHINSGIPNHAFYLVAQALGGNVWDRSARIWFEAFTNVLNRRASFQQAALATASVARQKFGEEAGLAVSNAWRAVGVQPDVRP